MTLITRSLLQALPKAELHCHLDGSVRPSTLLELGREYRVVMPRDDVDALADYMIVRDARTLEDYLQRFDVTLSVMQTAEAIERIAYELACDAAAEGVFYLETRYAPILNERQGLEWGATIEAAIRGLERAEREHGIVGRVIVCALRHLSPATSLELARLAVAYHTKGVAAFDLAGGESGNPAANHAAAFDFARANGLPCTCHAGEGDGAGSIAQAVHQCHAHRIGHATRLIEDESLTREVAERNLPLEICLTSNVQTHAATSYETHPFREYLRRGMRVVLNTDNRLMSGVNLVDEYAIAAHTFDLDLPTLARLSMNGFESAFVPDALRASLIARAQARLTELGA